MSEAILYIDSSAVREGELARVKASIQKLVAFIAANEPQLISYNFYFDEKGTRMTVVAEHPDSASLEFHMKVGGPAFRKFTDLIRLETIDVYGRPSAAVLDRLWQKARMLGNATVQVHERYEGFTRKK